MSPAKTKKSSGKGGKRKKKRIACDIFSPEGVLVMLWAITLDLLGFVDLLPVIGNIASVIVSVLGMSTLGLWVFIKTKHMPPRARNRYVLKKVGTRGLIGFVPGLAALPLWTIYIFKECKDGNVKF